MRNRSVLAFIALGVVTFAHTAGAEVDREKLSKEPGVYATFAVFKVGDQWSQMEKVAYTPGSFDNFSRSTSAPAACAKVTTARAMKAKTDLFRMSILLVIGVGISWRL